MQNKNDSQDTSSFRNELEKILLNNAVDVLIVGEQHNDDLARQCIIQNIDLIAEQSKTRPIVVLMEHLGEKKSRYFSRDNSWKPIDVKNEVKLSLENSQLSEPLETALEACSFWGKQYAQLAKICIKNGIEIGGAETDITNNRSAFSDYQDRLVSGDEAFTEAVNSRVNSVDKPLVILLCGIAHTFGVKSKLVDKGIIVIAAAVTLTTTGKSSYLFNCTNNEILVGTSPLIKNHTDQFDIQIDLMCKIDTSIETQYQPEIAVETQLSTEIDTANFKISSYYSENLTYNIEPVKIEPLDLLIADYGLPSQNNDKNKYNAGMEIDDSGFISNFSEEKTYDTKSFQLTSDYFASLLALYHPSSSRYKTEVLPLETERKTGETIIKQVQNSIGFFANNVKPILDKMSNEYEKTKDNDGVGSSDDRKRIIR